MLDPYVLTLAREYVDLVSDMGSGAYTNEELHALDSQRQWQHNELIRVTGIDPTEDMFAYCVRLLHFARGSNLS